MGRIIARLGAGLGAVALAAGLLTGCSEDDAPERAEIPADFVRVDTPVGTLQRPPDWLENPEGVSGKIMASFRIEEGGEAVGQLDVIVDKVDEGTNAEGYNAANQGNRALYFEDLVHVEQQRVEVPGARSAFRDESTYAVDGRKGHSVEQVSISEDGDLLLVRVSTLEEAFEDEEVEAVMDSITMVAPASS